MVVVVVVHFYFPDESDIKKRRPAVKGDNVGR